MFIRIMILSSVCIVANDDATKSAFQSYCCHGDQLISLAY